MQIAVLGAGTMGHGIAAIGENLDGAIERNTKIATPNGGGAERDHCRHSRVAD